MRGNKKTGFAAVALFAALLFTAVFAQAAKVGDQLTEVELKDAQDNPARIPDFGEKVLLIIYADSKTADANDPVADAVRDSKPDESRFTGMGVANLKDSWEPNAIIRMVIRRKVKQYNQTILTDDDRILARKWGLGDCNDKSVVMVVGKDRRLKYLKKGEVRGGEIEKVVGIIKAEIEK